MWKKVSRKKIDLEKYTACLQQSDNYKIYAENWYLDIVAKEKWYCYVWEDYKAIMPVCYEKKLMQKRVVQPIFCQQLGLFSSDTITQDNFNQVFELLKKSWVKSYSFNDKNVQDFKIKAKEKKNFVLDINRPYASIEEGYHKNTKRNLKKAQEYLLYLEKTTSLNELLAIKKDEDSEKIKTFIELYKALESRNLAYIVEVKNNDDEVLAVSLWMISKEDLIYSLSGSTEKGKKEFAMFHLVDKMIEKNAEKYKSIDFEGSMDKGVATFYKRFSAVDTPYATLKSLF